MDKVIKKTEFGEAIQVALKTASVSHIKENTILS